MTKSPNKPSQTVSDVEELDALAAAAAAAGADPVTGEVLPPGASETPNTVYGTGIQSASSFSPKGFFPRDPDWIRLNILCRPAGEHMLIGQISGEVTRIERKINTWEGKEIPSIVLNGVFMAKSSEGRQTSFPTLFLPRSYSEQIAHAFEHGGASRVEIEVDCGIRVLAKPPHYEWTITYYAEGKAIQALKQRMASRQLGQPPAAVLQVEAQKQEMLRISDAAAD